MGSLSKLEIETDVKAQLKFLLSQRAALATLSSTLPSARVMKTKSTLVQTQDVLLGLGKKLVGKEKTFLNAVAYLFWVEASTNLLIDILIIMLSATGEVFHIEPDDRYKFIRHAKTIEDLESPSVSLAMKIGFLEKCDLSCFKKYVDRDLRNRIAHADFEVDDKGLFIIYEKRQGQIKKKRVDLNAKIRRLNEFNSVVMHEIKSAVDNEKRKQKNGR